MECLTTDSQNLIIFFGFSITALFFILIYRLINGGW